MLVGTAGFADSLAGDSSAAADDGFAVGSLTVGGSAVGGSAAGDLAGLVVGSIGEFGTVVIVD